MEKTLFPIRRGVIVQDYDDNFLPDFYKSLGLKSHGGLDIVSYWADLVFLPESGVCYKVWDEVAPTIGSVTHGFGVNILTSCNEAGIAREHMLWHMRSTLRVKEGQFYEQGTIVGEEGASGQVYRGGLPIPDELKGKPPYYGTHLHWAYRDIQRVRSSDYNGTEFLIGPDGNKYQDKEGYFYRVLNTANGNRGFLNPLALPIIYYDEWIIEKTRELTEKTTLVVKSIETEVETKKNLLEDLIEFLKNVVKVLSNRFGGR